jgi:hypothetical protein
VIRLLRVVYCGIELRAFPVALLGAASGSYAVMRMSSACTIHALPHWRPKWSAGVANAAGVCVVIISRGRAGRSTVICAMLSMFRLLRMSHLLIVLRDSYWTPCVCGGGGCSQTLAGQAREIQAPVTEEC